MQHTSVASTILACSVVLLLQQPALLTNLWYRASCQAQQPALELVKFLRENLLIAIKIVVIKNNSFPYLPSICVFCFLNCHYCEQEPHSVSNLLDWMGKTVLPLQKICPRIPWMPLMSRAIYHNISDKMIET